MADLSSALSFLGQYFDIIRAVIVILAAFFVAKTVNYVLKHWAVKLTAKTKTNLDDMLINAIRRPIVIGAILFGIYYAFTTISYLLPYEKTFNQGFLIVQTYFIALVIARVINTVFDWYARDVAVKTETKLDDHFLPAMKKVVYLIAFLLGTVYLMDAFGVEVTTIIATLGIGGLAIALALQDTLSNFFAGAYTTLERPIRVNDFIELESGDKGFVVEIGWRTTKLRRLDNNLVIIPNSKLAQSKIIDYDLPNQMMALVIPCGVSYESDLEKVEKVTVEVAKKVMKEHAGISEFKEGEPPFIRYSEFGDSNINFNIILRVKSVLDQYKVKHELIKQLKARFDREGIEISVPARKLYMAREKPKTRRKK
ncbi:MAG: mechanosensitive ion channel [Candidatus Aenigmatarchaeota archaeon]